MFAARRRIIAFLGIIGLVTVGQLIGSNESHSTKGTLFTTGALDRDYDIYVEKSNPSEIKMLFRLKRYQIGTDRYDNITAHDIVVRGAGKNRNAGMPTLPTIRIPVAIPDCDDVKVKSRVIKKSSRNDMDLGLWPSKKEFAKPIRHSEDVNDSRDGKKGIVSIERITSIRNQKVAIVSINPVAYDSRSKTILLSDEIEVSLMPISPKGAVNVSMGPMEPIAGQHLANRALASGPLMAGVKDGPRLVTDRGSVTWCGGSDWRDAADSVISVGTDYLIIAIEGLRGSLVQELAEHRANFNGFNVSIVTMDDIDDTPDTASTPDTLRAFIKKIYDEKCAAHMADSLLGYVLLLGDATEPDGSILIPSYYGWTSPNHKCSDAYYSLLSEDSADDDYFADIYLGRIPVDTVSSETPPNADWELDNVVEKIKEYQPDELANKRILMVSGSDITRIPSYHDFFDYVEDMYIPGFIDGDTVTVDTLHREDYPISRSFDDDFSDIVGDRLEENSHWILGLIGHGAPSYLGDAFFPIDYDTLQNSQPFPLVFTAACELGRFDMEIDPGPFHCLGNPDPSAIRGYSPTTALDTCDAFAERMVLMENGAIGVLAYTRLAPDMDVTANFAYYFKAIFEDNAYGLGEILLSSRYWLFPDRNLIASRNLSLFGDPALNIVWENYGDVSVDSTDIVVNSRGISFPDAVKGRYLGTGESVDVKITVHNRWHTGASQIPIEVWDGDPDDESSTLLARDTLASVPSYGNTITTVDVGTLAEGIHEIHVVADTTEFDEPSFDNNHAFNTVRVYEYKDGYPVILGSTGTHSVTIADVSPSYSGKEILVNTAFALTCWSAAGDSLWDVHTTTYGDNSGFVNGTPIATDVYNNGVNYCMFIDSLLYVLNGESGAVVDTVAEVGEFDGWAWNCYQGQIMAVADIYPGGDSKEVIFTRRQISPSFQLSLSCYEIATGQEKWEKELGAAMHALSPCEIAVGDSDGNGSAEISFRTTTILSSSPDTIYVFDYDGTSEWRTAGGGHTPYSFADLSLIPSGIGQDDQVKMYVITTNIDYDADKELSVHRYDHTGADTSWSLGTNVLRAYLSVGDVDNDGTIEAIVSYAYMDGKYTRGVIKILSTEDGTVETTLNSDYQIIAMPVLADVDADAYSEIILVADHFEWNARPNSEYVLQIRNHDLTLSKEFSFPYDPNEMDELYAAGIKLGSMPAVDDIDDDGEAEIAFVSPDSVLHVIELGDAGNNEWAQRYKNPAQRNNYRQLIGGDYSMDVSIADDIEVISDAIFRQDVYVAPGSKLLISDEDEGGGGVDSLLVEFRVHGALEAKGTETYPIRFVAWDGQQESTAKDDWRGIFVHDDSSDASATFEYCEIKNAQKAIGTNVDITVKDCTIEMCDLLGISIAGADSVFVENTTIRDTDVAGINLLENSIARVSGCTIENMDGYGVDAYSGAKLYADGTVVRNCEWGIRVFIGDSLTVSGEIDSCSIVSNNDMGLIVYGTSDVTVTDCVIDSNAVNGVYCDSSASVTIDDNSIEHNAVGIYCYDHSDASITNNSIKNNSTGVICDDDSDAFIEENVIADNGTAVAALNDADPDLGHSGGGGGVSSGNNSIHNNTGFHVANFTIGLTVKAENNYWKGKAPLCYPKASKISGTVDYIPALCDDPGAAAPLLTEATTRNLPTVYSLAQNFPNPFNPTTTIRYDVPAPGGLVRIVVYNVKGQRVTTLVDSHELPGYHKVTWDGTNRTGNNVASGVYFIQMKAGGFVKTKKLLLLK